MKEPRPVPYAPSPPMPAPRKSPHCGAHVASSEARSCEFCGTEIPTPPPAPQLPPAGASVAARLAALHSRPELAELMLRVPSAFPLLARSGCGVAGMVVFLVVAGGMTVFFGWIGTQTGIPIWIVPLFMLGFGLILLIGAVRRGARVASAPLQRRIAAVVEKRTEIKGSDDSTTTHHFATLEGEDGQRAEYELEGKLSGMLARDDVGVAYTRADVLIDFHRLK